jgi:membrane fusion protein, multidrug efflux system
MVQTFLKITLTLLTILFVSCGENKNKPAMDGNQVQNQGPVQVEVKTIEQKPFTVILTYKSTMSGLNETIVKSELNDKIEKVFFKVGDKVKKGDIIVQFPEGNSGIQFSQAKIAFENAEKSYLRVKEQVQSGGASIKELTAIEKQYNVSKQNYETIKRMIYVESPAEGTILELFVKEGAKSSIGKELFKVGDEKSVVAIAWATETEKPTIRRGMKSIMTLDGKDYAGRVTAISDTIDNKSNNFRVETQYGNPGNKLKSGVEVEVRIIIYENKSSLVIPSNCILSEAGRQYIYVLINGKAEKRYINTGRNSGMEIEVTDGIKAGEPLIISGQTMLKDGDSVHVER